MSRWVFLPTLIAVACSTEKRATNPSSLVDTGQATTATVPTDTGTPPIEPSVTWHEHVKPLLQTHCTRCHYDGGLAVGDFTDINLVRSFSEIMLARIDSGEMPPPVADPDCRDFVGSEHLQMPVEARDTFADWVSGGQAEGDIADAPIPLPISDELTDSNMTVQIEQPYVPLYEDASNPGNEYRCFVIDPELEDNVFITALAPMVDQKSMVHHIVLFTKSQAEIAEDELGPQGYDCIDSGMADGVNGMVAGWAPGMLPVEFPEGHGMRLGPNDRLILQMHYYQSGPDVVGVADQSGYAFRVVDEVDHRVLMFPAGMTNFEIPAGDGAYTDGFEWQIPSYLNFNILGVFPHMHTLGSGYRMWADTAADGSICLAESDRYDFDNQQTYMFREPVPIQGGDSLGFECTWDNSEENPDQFYDTPQDIGYGERTDEEMCYSFTLLGL